MLIFQISSILKDLDSVYGNDIVSSFKQFQATNVARFNEYTKAHFKLCPLAHQQQIDSQCKWQHELTTRQLIYV